MEGRRPDGDQVSPDAPDTSVKICIYPGCDRPAVPPHPLGGPQPAFCDREDHNALTAHLARKRLEASANDDQSRS